MGTATATILLFGDGTVDPVSTVRQLAQDAKRFVSVDSFLRSSASALRSELSRTTSPSAKQYPQFTSILELAEWYSALTVPCILVQPVLLCIAQLGVLLREHELNPSSLNQAKQNPLYCIGLCNGMIAAAAAAVCTSSLDLLALGPRLVCLNCRLLLALVDRSDAIERSDETWTIVTPGLCADDHVPLIDNFISHEGPMPIARQPYVSAEGESVSTISGPPSTLVRYFKSCDTLRQAKQIKTGINTACHAPHLQYSDCNSILGEDPLWKSYYIKEGVFFPSINTGENIVATTLATLLLRCIDEILNKRFRWSTVVHRLCHNLKSSCLTAKINPVGPDRVSKSLVKTFQEFGIESTITEFASLPRTNILPSYDDVAIVGVSSRLPGGGVDLEHIWQLLREGRDTHTQVPSDRFDIYDHYDPLGKKPNTTSVPYGCFIEKPGDFDAKLFNMSAREARQTDPMQRLALLTTYEALEMAGYSPNTLPSFSTQRIATFFGQTVDDYRETNACQDVDIYFVSGGVRAFGPGRMNYHFKWEGPSMSVDTACSSSALAIHLAFQSLRSNECDLGVAGGMNIITGSDMYAGLARGGFLSKSGQCKTFDNSADGYCRGEGVGTVVLKRLQDAIADRDNILGVIKAASTNHSVHSASITRPDIKAQVKVMRQVLMDAGLDPCDVDYVEMHGTGTQVGDATEFSSVSEVFGHNRSQKNTFRVGSIKANCGHGEAAAGINSLVKALLMLRHSSIPPNIGIKTALNSKFTNNDLATTSINQRLEAFPREGPRPRRIVLNSFNATGGNTAMLIEDAPIPVPVRSEQDPRSFHITVVTGHTEKSFLANRKNLLHHLSGSHHNEVRNISYTTTARRLHHKIRAAYVAQDIPQLVEGLSRDVNAKKVTLNKSTSPILVFAFTGQGSHYLDRARQLLHTNPVFRDRLLGYDSMCENQGLPSFLDIIRNDTTAHTQVQFQLSIVAIQMALVATLKAWGIAPDAVIGHSIGEYAALHTAGVLTDADALHLVGKRAQAIEEYCKPGEQSMLAVSTDLHTIERVLMELRHHKLAIACYNGPTSFVVSGPVEDLLQLQEMLDKYEIQYKRLEIEFGFHSTQMHNPGSGIHEFCSNVCFHKPMIPVASTLLGKVVDATGTFNGDYLSAQTTSPVKFSDALNEINKYLGTQTGTLWIEIGTHPTCGAMITSTLGSPAKELVYLLRRNEDPWRSVSTGISKIYEAGVDVDWAHFHSDYLEALSVVELPRYAFDLENYWIPYQNSWKLKKGRNETENTTKTASVDPRLAPFHYLKQESISKKEAKVTFVCDLSEPVLLKTILGHLVEGVGLCPSSVYAHLAFNATAYVLRKVAVDSRSLPAMDVGAMDIVSPLKVTAEGQQPILKITTSWNSAVAHLVQVEFASERGSVDVVHCRCRVTIGEAMEWQNEWQEHEYLIQSRVGQLRGISAQPVHTIYRGMLYKLFASAVVKYSDEYQVCHHINVDYDQNECAAELRIPTTIKHHNGSPGPFCLDAVMHIAGFVLNSQPEILSDTVFIASGWKSLRLAQPLLAGKVYVCHTRMHFDNKSSTYEGNVNILFEDRIIGTCRGLKFHRLKRNSLRKLLGVSQADNTFSRTSNSSSNRNSVQNSVNCDPKPSYDLTNESQDVAIPAKSKNSLDGILEDIAAETGAPINDITESTQFSTLGIDSILTISLLDRFRERTGLNLPVNTFSVCHTIGELGEFLSSKFDSNLSKDSKVDELEKHESSEDDQDSSVNASGVLKSRILRSIIAEELGIDESNVKASSTTQELGLDSILSLSIMSAYEAQTGQKLGARFFSDNVTIAEIMDRIDDDVEHKDESSKPTPDLNSKMEIQLPATPDFSSSSSEASTALTSPMSPATTPIQSCATMLLQGNAPNTGHTPALFLLPDGSGSLFSYINVPEIKPGLAVYGLDSPFHKNPKDFSMSFFAVAQIYVKEIRKIQPKGPYMIGGWSLGGVHAYEVSRQLLEAGENVSRLVMIDSPCPGTLPPLPHASLDLLEKAGIFEGLGQTVGKVANHTREHFVKITEAFFHWDYRPLNNAERAKLGTVSVIWGQNGVLEDDEEANNACVPGIDQADADAMKAKEWLTGKRPNFQGGGWDKLSGKEVQVYTMPGNHFSMMFPPLVSELAVLLRKIL